VCVCVLWEGRNKLSWLLVVRAVSSPHEYNNNDDDDEEPEDASRFYSTTYVETCTSSVGCRGEPLLALDRDRTASKKGLLRRRRAFRIPSPNIFRVRVKWTYSFSRGTTVVGANDPDAG
jgi:hypothetical protein